jgi:HAD superfamily hydrolase (TIGR01549 family)
MARSRLILFDLDDTLCDYSGARTGRLLGAYGQAFEGAGVTDIDLDAIVAESIAIHPHGSDHFPDLLARHGVDDPELARDARRWYHHNRFLGLDLYPGARTVLDTVRALPDVHAVGLITNGPSDVQQDKITLLNLAPHIDFAVISGEFGIEKPDPAIFREALRLGNSAPDDAIYIGDSPEFDMDGAFAAGIDRIWMNPKERPWQRPTPEPARQIRTIDQVIDILRN